MRTSLTTPMTLALLALAAPMLAGCNGFFGHSRTLSEEMPDRQPLERMAEIQLAAGRAALGNGEYAAAVMAYRNARLSPAHAGDAYNGMAIAYSYMGRPDLAERFFRQAVIENPADPRFSANLTRFQRQAAALAARDAAATSARLKDASVQTAFLAGQGSVTARPQQAGRGIVRIALPTARLVKVSGHEQRLVIDGGAARPARSAARAAYPVRITVSQGGRAAYPARVGFAPAQNR